jgi:hypothetical protein
MGLSFRADDNPSAERGEIDGDLAKAAFWIVIYIIIKLLQFR